MSATPYSPAALRFFKARAISAGAAISVKVCEEGDDLVYPNGRRRSLNGAGPKVWQPKGKPLEPWVVITGEGRAILVAEGESDALAAVTALGTMPPVNGDGELTILSVPGTGCPPERVVDAAQVQGASLIYIATDADEAGNRYAEKLVDAGAAAGLEARRVQLPEGADLAEVLVEADPAYRGKRLAELLREAVDPRPGPDTAELLDLVAATIRRFVVLSDEQRDTVALWTLHTHAIEVADSTPYLAITSPEKQSGKSRLLEVLAQFVPRALEAANISDAALFRALGGDGLPATLLFDEIDSVFGAKARDREDLRGMINAGWRRGAMAYRCVGDGARQEVTAFPVFGAKALAGIGELPDTVADRCIPIRMRRRAPDEPVQRGRYRDIVAACEPLRKAASEWAQRQASRLQKADPDLPEKLSDREQDGAEPLLAIADLAGGDWPTRARKALIALHGGKGEDSESWGVQLLGDIQEALKDREHIGTEELLEALKADPEAPWGSWGKTDNGLGPRSLAKLLKPYGIRSGDVHTGDGEDRKTLKGYAAKDFKDAWDRYLRPDPPPDTDPNRANRANGSTEPKTGGRYPRQEGELARIEIGRKPHGKADGADGAPRNRDKGAEAVEATPGQEAEADRLFEKFEGDL